MNTKTKNIFIIILKILLMGLAVAGCIAACFDSCSREEECDALGGEFGKSKLKTTSSVTKHWQQPTIERRTHAIAQRTAPTHSSQSSVNGSLYTISEPPSAYVQINGGGTRYATNQSAKRRSTPSAVATGISPLPPMRFGKTEARAASNSATTTSQSHKVVVNEPFSDEKGHGNNNIQRVVDPGSGGGWTDPSVPTTEETPIGGALVPLLLCASAYFVQKKRKKK